MFKHITLVGLFSILAATTVSAQINPEARRSVPEPSSLVLLLGGLSGGGGVWLWLRQKRNEKPRDASLLTVPIRAGTLAVPHGFGCRIANLPCIKIFIIFRINPSQTGQGSELVGSTCHGLDSRIRSEFPVEGG